MNMEKQDNKTEAESELSFEKALERLEKIVAEMESGELPLAESMKRFEEGSKLANFCTRKLGETEKRIEILMNKDQEGELDWAEFGSQD